ncbi:MAG: hypothetical protein WC213_02365, partial [Arenimonas sp.]
ILAAVAIPKFIDLSTEANAAALDGVEGSLTSAMAINYAGCAALNNTPTANKCVAVDDCGDVASLLTGGVPAGYSVTAGAIAAPNGTTAACVVVQSAGPTNGAFTGIRAGM